MWNSRWSTYHFASVSGFGEAIAVCSSPLNISWIVARTDPLIPQAGRVTGASIIHPARSLRDCDLPCASFGGRRNDAFEAKIDGDSAVHFVVVGDIEIQDTEL